MTHLMKPTATLAAVLAATLGLVTPAAARGPGMDGGHGGGMPLMQRFDEIDVNKDGKITVEEITVFRQAQVAGTDANADGKLSAEELAAQEMRMMSERAAARAAKMIERFDADGDGLLSAEELASRPMPTMIFERLDEDGDGAISKDEAEAARAMMAENREHRGGGWRHWGQGDGN